MQQRYLFGLQVKQVVVTRPATSRRRSVVDAHVRRMREIKERLCLRTADLQAELKAEGFKITNSSLSAYLQGSIRSAEKQAAVLAKMEAVYKRLYSKHTSLIDPSMAEIFDKWCASLEISGFGCARRLARIVGHDPSSLWKWYNYNTKPLPLSFLIEMQARVDAELQRRGHTAARQ